MTANTSASTFLSSPGRRPEPGESLIEALERECLEETGAKVRAGPILMVRDYIGRNHEFGLWDQDVHQVEIMFACQVQGEYDPTNGPSPDADQVGVEWIGVDELSEYRIYPAALRDYLREDSMSEAGAHYLGDVN